MNNLLEKWRAGAQLARLCVRYVVMPSHSLSKIEFGYGLKRYAPNLFRWVQQKRHAFLELSISKKNSAQKSAQESSPLYATAIENYAKGNLGEHILNWSSESLAPFFAWVDQYGPVLHLIYLKTDSDFLLAELYAHTASLEGAILCVVENDTENDSLKEAFSAQIIKNKNQKCFFLSLRLLYNFSPPFKLDLPSEVSLYFLLRLFEPAYCHILDERFFLNFISLLPQNFLPTTNIMFIQQGSDAKAS